MLIAKGGLRSRARLVLVALVLSLCPFVLPAAPAHADFTAICNGYAGCRSAGYGNSGYQVNSGTMYWRMYSGHNCTNYAAYRMVHAGMPNSRPWSGAGNAENWGHAMAYLTDQTPTVGAIAWFDAYEGYAGSAGHVAYVERVVSSSEIIVSEDMWGGDFHWRRVTKSGRGWPSGFIHFHDVALQSRTAPAVDGTPQVGQTLTADPGRWSATPTSVSYQWFADGELVDGATASTFTPGAGRVGQRISVQVAAKATGYASALATSAASAPVAPGVITTVSTPAISGAAELGSVLTATKGTWAPGRARKTVQWQSDGTAIPGATSWTLQLGRAQVGTRVTAVVTATRSGYSPATVATAPTPSVLGGPILVNSPFSVTGTPEVGQTLAVGKGVVDPDDATAAYTWLRDGVRVPGATAETYPVGAADVGSQLSVRVQLSRTGYQSTTVETDPTAVVPMVVPELEIRAVSHHVGALVVVNVRAPGLEAVEGSVTVRVGSQPQTLQLVSPGRARAVFTGLHAGTRTVVVAYSGVEGLIVPARYRSSVEVLPPRRG